jgi:hypothetical protein
METPLNDADAVVAKIRGAFSNIPRLARKSRTRARGRLTILSAPGRPTGTSFTGTSRPAVRLRPSTWRSQRLTRFQLALVLVHHISLVTQT